MTLKSTTTRAKLLTTSEDLAVQMGKINKWYDSLVPTGGASGNILGWNSDGTAKWVTGSLTDEKVKATLLAQSTAEGSYRPTFVTGAGTAGVNIIDSFKVDHTPGTTSVIGNTRLVLGNATASGTANNEEGQIKLYSSGTALHNLKGAAISTEATHVLPSTGGTILNTGTTSYTQTSSSSATGAYEIGKIKINGTTTTIYGKDTNTTYTASDGIKIESSVIKHTNAITAVTTAGFYKFKFDAQGHITGTTSVAASDIPALNYVPNTQAGMNAAINLLSTGSSTPTDADYYISQYVGGGTTTTTYHRRPMSALWSYVKGKADSVYAAIDHTHPLSIAADSGTSQLTLSASTKYKLTAGGSSFVFTTSPNTTYSAGDHLSLSSTTFSLASYCKSITDWNSATTNGWYMGSSVTNAPSTAWWFGRVVAHNNKYCMQEVWQFTASTNGHKVPHKMRMFVNDVWGDWVDVTVGTQVPENAVFTDTKNTAGSTDTSSKIYLIGATSQAANPQTYSDNEVYTTSGVLTTKKVQVGGGSCTMEYNSTTETLDFVFA